MHYLISIILVLKRSDEQLYDRLTAALEWRRYQRRENQNNADHCGINQFHLRHQLVPCARAI